MNADIEIIDHGKQNDENENFSTVSLKDREETI